MKDAIETKHESFGKVVVSRVSGHATLFQSPHKHQHYISIKLHQAKVYRDLSQDWVHEDGLRPVVEFSMSEAQWAHMVASAGLGMGTPCTINSMTDGQYKRCEPPPEAEVFRETYKREAEEHGRRAIACVEQAMALMTEMLDGKRKMNKAEVNATLDQLKKATRELGPNFGFVMSQFEEALDKNLNAAKTELEAHGLAALNQIALSAIANRISPEAEQKLLDSVVPPAGQPVL